MQPVGNGLAEPIQRAENQCSVCEQAHVGKKHIEEIRTRPQEQGKPRFDKTDLQRLQRFMVNMYQYDFEQLRALRQISQLLPNLELYVLSEGFYHAHLGLLIQHRPSEDFLL